MTLDPKKCKPGEEQYEKFVDQISSVHERTLIQYDYRNKNGKLFSCITSSVAHARKRRDTWAKTNGM